MAHNAMGTAHPPRETMSRPQHRTRDFVETLPPLIADRYRPVRPLGKGGMSSVYVVEHVHTTEQLALKVLALALADSETTRERFKREAKTYSQIKSDYVVRIVDAGVSAELGQLPFLVMELLDGVEIAAVLRSGGPQPVQRVLAWAKQIGKGLARAHAVGCIHRDLKPANLFLVSTEDGERVKILDFGVAKMLGEAPGARTTGQAIIGTPRYMSPEQIKGENALVGPQADVWSLSLVIFEMLAGRQYWQGDTPAELLAQALFGDQLPPSQCGCDLGPAFDQWFLQCTQREVPHRIATVQEQIELLVRAVEHAPDKRERVGVAARGTSGVDSTSPAVAPQGVALRAPLASASDPTMAPATARLVPGAEPPRHEPTQRIDQLGLTIVPNAFLQANVTVQRGQNPAKTMLMSLPHAAAPQTVPIPIPAMQVGQNSSLTDADSIAARQFFLDASTRGAGVDGTFGSVVTPTPHKRSPATLGFVFLGLGVVVIGVGVAAFALQRTSGASRERDKASSPVTSSSQPVSANPSAPSPSSTANLPTHATDGGPLPGSTAAAPSVAIPPSAAPSVPTVRARRDAAAPIRGPVYIPPIPPTLGPEYD